jgi:hypothetical protein
MSAYADRQFVGIDLHRRGSVIVRTTASGEVLQATRRRRVCPLPGTRGDAVVW